MSPRRRLDTATDTDGMDVDGTDTDGPDSDGTKVDGTVAAPARRRRWRPSRPRLRGRDWRATAVASVAAVVLVAALVLSTLMLVSARDRQRADARDAAALDFVASFMSLYLSPDPQQANEYADRVQALATGDFATEYAGLKNQVVLVVGLGAQTSGTVVTKAIERWNGDGSVTALVVMEVARASPDGTTATTLRERYAVGAIEEGDRWKINAVTSVF